jgi:uncharacterized protein YyaL (SSP411 family)
LVLGAESRKAPLLEHHSVDRREEFVKNLAIRPESEGDREAITRFWDDDGEGFFFTASDHEDLIVRKKTSQDGAIPSGNSVAAIALLRLGKLLEDDFFFRERV